MAKFQHILAGMNPLGQSLICTYVGPRAHFVQIPVRHAMTFDFAVYPLQKEGYSGKQMTFVDPQPTAILSTITQIALIETGSRSTREHWHQVQLRNLVNTALQRSEFWRGRIGNRGGSEARGW
jgi:hypothetical protein